MFAGRVVVVISILSLLATAGTARQAPTTPTHLPPPPAQAPPAPSGPPASPGTPAPRGDVQLAANLVTLTVVVRDGASRLVPDLTASDFAITEDGTPREFDHFSSHGEVPLRLVLLFDTSVSVKDRIDFEKRAAARFFTRAVRPGDRAALFSFATKFHKVEPLTDSTDTLARAVETLKIAGITAFNEAVARTAKYLGDAAGRRVIVLLSDGHDTVRPEGFDEALKRAQSVGATVYAISPAGADDNTPAGKAGAATLRRLAAATGGTAFFPPVRANREAEAADLDEIFGRIVDELRAHYVLTYYSDGPREDGRFHTVKVEVKRPGLVATYRSGYYDGFFAAGDTPSGR